MGYNLQFGEFEVESSPKERYASATAKGPDAGGPYNSSGDNSAACYPGYGQWSDFARRWGLHDAFFKKWEGLIANHPGVAEVKEEHAQLFADTLERFTRETGITSEELDRRAKIETKSSEQMKAVRARVRSGELTRANACELEEAERRRHADLLSSTYYDGLRLRWLAYWSRWVLDNTEYPTFANS
jgi:hypothetical protein